MQPAQTQAEQKATDAVHYATVAELRKEVQRKTVPQYCGESRVLEFVAPNRDTGKVTDNYLIYNNKISWH